MPTDRIRDELVAFVCGELEEPDRARLQAALEADPAMAAEARELAQALLAVTPSGPACVGEDFNSRLRERLEKEGLAQRGAARHLRWRRPVLFKAGLAVAAAAAAVIAAGLWMLLAPGGEAGVAFADVRQRIEQAQTMTVTAIVEMKGMIKPMTTKMYFKSPGLMRQEIAVEGNTTTAPGTTQTATAPAARKVVTIFDILNQKGVTLLPDQKKAMVFEFKNVPAEALAQARQQNVLEELKKAVAGEHEELGEKKINGQKAKGYRCKGKLQTAIDIWVDASTGTPLLVEEMLPEGIIGKVTMTDFVMNPALDDSLFDTSVPEGYNVESQTLDFNVREDELITGVGVLAKHCGDVFPKSLLSTPELIKQLAKSKISEEKIKELGEHFQKVVLFQVRTMQGGEFVYAGDGVKLGDKTTPILWYKAKDAKTYRVIYGDLRAEDAETAPQRPATQPSQPGAPAQKPGPKPAGGESP